MRGVRRQVGHPDPRPDQRALVADHVDAVEQVRPRRDVADVEPVRVRGRGSVGVRLREEYVDAHDLVAGGGELAVDLGPDEAGRPGEQDPHASS